MLHLSDTHFGTEQPRVVEALVALAAQQRPDVVVLSGDITQRARPAQFRAAKAFVDRLGAPVLAIPGNHDIALLDVWARLTRPYARYAQVFGADLEPVVSSPDWLIVGVNTTRAWRHVHGEVSAAQIARVATVLSAATPEQLRVVVVHQPLAVPAGGEASNLLRGHAEATRAWAQAGADIVMGGHIHLPFTLPLQGLGRRLCVVQAGTAVSTRTRPGVPNSVNLLRWADAAGTPELAIGNEPPPAGRCLIERWDFSERLQAFVRAEVTVVQPER
ncbi:metallophosphoesterase family protein [Rhodoferax lacus]